jgi:hypothetical protein
VAVRMAMTLLLLIVLVTFANITFAKVTLYLDRIERVTCSAERASSALT